MSASARRSLKSMSCASEAKEAFGSMILSSAMTSRAQPEGWFRVVAGDLCALLLSRSRRMLLLHPQIFGAALTIVVSITEAERGSGPGPSRPSRGGNEHPLLILGRKQIVDYFTALRGLLTRRYRRGTRRMIGLRLSTKETSLRSTCTRRAERNEE